MCDGGCECGDAGVSPTRRESAYDMLRVSEAVCRVLAVAAPLEAGGVAARKAKGLVLAEPVRSTEPLPPFRASVMDGYAVVAADGVGTYPVVERIAAGGLPSSALTVGQVTYITTGSPVPDGADAVVKVEDTSAVDGDERVVSASERSVNILKAVKPGQNVRAIGSDIQPGELLVDAHELVTAAEIGLMATVGVTQVTAYRRPIVGVLSTGSELVEAFSDSTPQGKIRDSNRPMLLGLLEEWDVETVDLGICNDKKEALRDALKAAFDKVDVLITSGGVSMGEHDLIKPLLEELGIVHFGRLFMKPGKPTTFATVVDSRGKTKLAFALPGNPVSTFTTCHLLVRPALKRLRGFPEKQCHHTKVHAVLTHPVRLDAERPEFHRATVSWDVKTQQFVATSTGIQMSSRLLSCRNANALLSLPTGTEIRDGDAVEAFLLDDAIANAAGSTSGAEKSTATPPTPVSQRQHNSSGPSTSTLKKFRAGLLTVSDSVSSGKSTDLSGPAMADMLQQYSKARIDVVATKVVPDDAQQIQDAVTRWADADAVDLILTSGGTGFSPRDVTPEAVKAVLDKEIPGFVLAMLQNSLRFTPKGILSRPVAGIRKQTLVVTLPGKPKAVVENFAALELVLPHALLLVRDVPHDHHRADPATRYT